MSWFVIQLKYEAEGHVAALRRDRPEADEHQQSCDDRRWDGNQQGVWRRGTKRLPTLWRNAGSTDRPPAGVNVSGGSAWPDVLEPR